jgi:hypothetical protein
MKIVPSLLVAMFGILLIANGVRHLLQHDPLVATFYALVGLAFVGEFLWRRWGRSDR